jgi:hypothetical protein
LLPVQLVQQLFQQFFQKLPPCAVKELRSSNATDTAHAANSNRPLNAIPEKNTAIFPAVFFERDRFIRRSSATRGSPRS